jgi:hypothetical protein
MMSLGTKLFLCVTPPGYIPTSMEEQNEEESRNHRSRRGGCGQRQYPQEGDATQDPQDQAREKEEVVRVFPV